MYVGLWASAMLLLTPFITRPLLTSFDETVQKKGITKHNVNRIVKSKAVKDRSPKFCSVTLLIMSYFIIQL